jgi:hypothetical protein
MGFLTRVVSSTSSSQVLVNPLYLVRDRDARRRAVGVDLGDLGGVPEALPALDLDVLADRWRPERARPPPWHRRFVGTLACCPPHVVSRQNRMLKALARGQSTLHSKVSVRLLKPWARLLVAFLVQLLQ